MPPEYLTALVATTRMQCNRFRWWRWFCNVSACCAPRGVVVHCAGVWPFEYHDVPGQIVGRGAHNFFY